MTPTHPLVRARAARRPATILAMALAMVLTLGAAGCGPATGTLTASSPRGAGPSASVAPSVSPAGTPSPSRPAGASPAPTVGLPGTTLTEWGPIWDDVPSRFPRKLGSEPTETGAGPASAILIVPARTQEAANWYAAALPAAGYRVEGASGPYEDGGYVIDATGTAPGCRVQVSLAKQGMATIATIYFGASCPFR